MKSVPRVVSEMRRTRLFFGGEVRFHKEQQCFWIQASEVVVDSLL